MSEDFKPLAIPPGSIAEKFKGAITAYNEQAKSLHEWKGNLLDELNPLNEERENAWQAIVVTAMRYSGGSDGKALIDPASVRLYDCMSDLFNVLLRENAKQPLGEFSDSRINELIPLLDQINAARPKRRHGLTKSPVPADLIYELAFLYQRYTGKKPGAGEGPFERFVHLFWNAMGHEREKNTVVRDIKTAYRSRPEAFEIVQAI